MNRATTGWNRIVSLIIWVVAGGFLVSALSFLTIVYQVIKPDRVQLLERL